ncbi:ATP-binding protein [Yinghuangia sp. YIM S09857]|uniref:ATP-binding protein n=1 Tax=Yinghuangia sp. YIM S09857 TaxID=3436929 RepID=UPI003F5347DF
MNADNGTQWSSQVNCKLHAAVVALDDRSAHELRHELVAWLRAHVDDDATQLASLLAGELLANVSKHARPPRGGPPNVALAAYVCSGQLVVEVSDPDPRPPVRRTARGDDESGRGLGLLDGFATAWGTHPDATGKTVWFAVPAPTGLSSRVGSSGHECRCTGADERRSLALQRSVA